MRLITLTGAAFFALGPLLAHYRLVPPLLGFGLWVIGSTVTLFGAVAGMILFFGRPSLVIFMNLIVNAFLATVAMVIVWARVKYPLINDITTDPEQPPQFQKTTEAHMPENRYRADFARRQRSAYPDLRPFVVDKPPQEVFGEVSRLARQMSGWTITRIDRDQFALEGVAVSRVFGFTDDFVIQIRPASKGSLVQMRSKSRKGVADFGANANRIRLFFAVLKVSCSAGSL